MPTGALSHLMSGYFHQDFDHDYGDDLGTVNAFLQDEPNMREDLLSDLDELLEPDPSSEDVETRLDAMGCEYYPARFDGDYADWIRALRDHIGGRSG